MMGGAAKCDAPPLKKAPKFFIERVRNYKTEGKGCRKRIASFGRTLRV